mgnify:CR=1 FL=1
MFSGTVGNSNLIAERKALEAACIALLLFDEVRAMTWRMLNPTR